MYTLLVFGSVIGYVVGGVLDSSKIINGTAVNIIDFPYQLQMLYQGSQLCGASIISAEWALSAAHCVEGRDLTAFSFRAGSSQRDVGGQVVNAISVIMHPKYNTTVRYIYDLVLAKVSPAFNLGQPGISKIRIGMIIPKAGVVATVSGWGDTYVDGTGSPILLAVNVTVVDQAVCNSSYGGSIAAPMMCASDVGKDSCQGDSGGPLVIRSTPQSSTMIQVGVVSFGEGCATPNVPGVYATLAHARLWIRRVSGV